MRTAAARLRAGEEGSGTVNCLAMIVLCILLAVTLGGVGAARSASVRLQAVADVASLAGAEQAATAAWEDVGERPCASASSVARANGAVVQSCEVRGSDCLVEVSSSVRIVGVPAILRARARAGTGGGEIHRELPASFNASHRWGPYIRSHQAKGNTHKGWPRKGAHRKTCTVLMGYSKGSASGSAPSSLCGAPTGGWPRGPVMRWPTTCTRPWCVRPLTWRSGGARLTGV